MHAESQPAPQERCLTAKGDHCIKPVVLKLLHKALGAAEYFLEVGGCPGRVESWAMWLTTRLPFLKLPKATLRRRSRCPQELHSHLQQEAREPRICCQEVLHAGKGEQGKRLCQKTKTLLHTQGKKKEISTKNNHWALRPPSTRCVCKVVSASCTELYSIAGAGRAGAAWSELSRWKGRIEMLTTRHSRRWVESHAKQMAWQVRRGGSKTQNKQNRTEKKKYMVHCSALVVLFRFGVLFYISSHGKNWYSPENSNLIIRTSLRTTLIEVDVISYSEHQHLCFTFHTCRLFLFKEKKCAWKWLFLQGNQLQVKQSAHLGGGVSTPLCISFWTLKQHMGCIPLQYVTGNFPNEHAS